MFKEKKSNFALETHIFPTFNASFKHMKHFFLKNKHIRDSQFKLNQKRRVQLKYIEFYFTLNFNIYMYYAYKNLNAV